MMMFSAALLGSESVPILIQERAGIWRSNEWVVFGLPVPRTWQVAQATQLRLGTEGGQSIPAQFDILARWGSHALDTNKPAKWVLVTYPETVAAHGSNTVYLSNVPGETPALPGITISASSADRLTVDTGAAVFDLNTNTFNLFEQVTIDGQPILTPLAASNAVKFVDQMGTNVVNATSQRAPRPGRAVIERSGPLYVVIKLAGSIFDGRQKPVLDFTARYHFHAGKAEARVDFTVENNYPIIADESDQPTNVHNQGSTNSVYVGGLQLAVRLAENPAAPLRVQMENDVNLLRPTEVIRLYQDSSGLPTWDAYVGLVGWETNITCAPRLQSYCSTRDYTITGSGGLPTGNQAVGWAAVTRDSGQGPRIQVAMRAFWQNFPKAMEVRPDGQVVVDLFPNGDVFHHNLRVGEQKTHTLLFRFGLGTETRERSDQLARAFNAPLFGQTPPQWVVQTKALGDVPPQNAAQWPTYEHYVQVAFEPNPEFDPDIHDSSFGNTTLRETIEKYNFFGWQDYGDVPLDYEAFGPNQAGQMNLKYWYLYGMFLQYCRSADLRWLELARPAAWHIADIDYLHIPDEGIQHWAHGAYFGHSNHDEPGNNNPNRNSNSPSDDLFFGVPDLLLGYYLTGENRFREVALEGLEAMLNLSQFADFTAPFLYRERANLIFAYIEGYRQTGDQRWLTALRTLVGETAKQTNKPWLADPSTYRPVEEWQWLSSFQLSQILWGLGRYLDLCDEYGFTDDLNITNALTDYSDFVLRSFTQEYQPGRAAAWNAFYFYDPHDEPYLEINSWALVMADVLASAYKYSGRTNYLEAAAKFYATGTIDPVWEGDPPVYMATKDLVNALNWGLAYMKISQPELVNPPLRPRLYIKSVSVHQTILEWDALAPPYRYAVEYINHLSGEAWTTLSGNELISTNTWIDNHDGPPTRFWRIRAEPYLKSP